MPKVAPDRPQAPLATERDEGPSLFYGMVSRHLIYFINFPSHYFVPSAEVAVYGRLLDTFISRIERPRINYHLNLRARPKYPECILELTATEPRKEIPSLAELSDYTWINPNNSSQGE
jgi:hypothetical protein